MCSSDLIGEKYGESFFDISIDEFKRGISDEYCRHHQRYFKGSRELQRHDVFYFTSKALRAQLGISEDSWKRVESLRQEREKVLEELSRRSIAGVAFSYVTRDSRVKEVQRLEQEIEGLLKNR